ncbi:Lipopolysaccharide assembly protein B [Saezia sanguinis]|uniref:Lipopolysaccharide assembly protein B n=1 Tax=Saezia sanguinis TaxID=1965230 RepID=A0A433SHB4_9BURK|nr:lipopolysaccharide assembly protein LapB [Saezia sanguinis]RUS68080.1 Lipopolysaccharide assembly protein B [Saezia sanguinis]
MDFELWWLFLIIPAVFALGWGASRFDIRQWRQEQLDAPRAYFKGLNFLLNEQQDKAIDAFIEAVQYDPNTSELHFALGNLFRRRGEYERAVRVHQHLLGRADLPTAERDRAQYALAQDYLKAGLLDRAEQSFRVLENIPAYSRESRMALLTLYERAHDWPNAIDVANALEDQKAGNFAPRRAHYHCELAAVAQVSGDYATVLHELTLAHHDSPDSPRPLIELARYHLKRGDVDAAFKNWAELARVAAQAVPLIAPEVAQFIQGMESSDQFSAQQQERWRQMALDLLDGAYAHQASLDILTAQVDIETDHQKRHARLLAYLEHHPSVVAAAELLNTMQTEDQSKETVAIRRTLERAAKPMDRYRCAACGFESTHYFWQCPGCQSWDSYPPRRVEEF